MVNSMDGLGGGRSFLRFMDEAIIFEASNDMHYR